MSVVQETSSRDAAAADGTCDGGCFCGAVRLRVRGEPVAMGYCHCESCRSWSAGPVNAFSLWKPEAVEIVQGEDQVATFAKTPRSLRKWCKACGGHLFAVHPHWDLVDVFAATIPGLRFEPGVHVNYQEARMSVKDGLPKMKDLPTAMGGSGETMAD